MWRPDCNGPPLLCLQRGRSFASAHHRKQASEIFRARRKATTAVDVADFTSGGNSLISSASVENQSEENPIKRSYFGQGFFRSSLAKEIRMVLSANRTPKRQRGPVGISLPHTVRSMVPLKAIALAI